MNKFNFILCAFFVLWFAGLGISAAVMPDRDFSEMENRVLSAFPKFTGERLFSGEFGEDFEEYLNDQFPARDFLKQASTSAQYAIGKREISGVYFAGDALAPVMTAEETPTEKIETLLSLKQTGRPLYTALIPDAACILEDKLPYGAPAADQKEIIDYVYAELGNENCADIYSELNAVREEEIFYRTDHHWTGLGAYYGYAAIMKTMGEEPIPLDSYAPEVLSDSFYGTLYSKAPAFWLEPDSITAYAPDMGTAVSLFDGNEFKGGFLYDKEKLRTKDKYAVFLGGNQPLIKLTTTAADKPRVLILRDSYADSLVPFLQQHFSEIHLIDARYFRQDIFEYGRENEIDVVMAVYSVAQFEN